MNAKNVSMRVLSVLLVLCMVIGLVPMGVFAAEEDTLKAAMDEAQAYIDALTVNNSSNDPSTVVSNFKTHFTWDNEKRENSKSYLFDWSYYNGVVFEGIEYLYEVTNEEVYKNYVVEYMSSMITQNGTWAKTSNNSDKEAAGYVDYHGADCYKTASLLLDTYQMTGDSRYLTMAETLYADLDSAAASYSLKNAGNNYHHTWSSASSPNLWLDGLYMILPFRAEYAKYIGDTEELDLIVSRMQWVSDNMYNKSNGLFYHAADSASSNSGTHWLRSIGWYAAAIVDIMDSMEGQNLETMKAQLVKLVDGMKAVQNSGNGMWLNNMKASQSSSNPYETSGTALVCYAVMKAVNNGWLDASYADMAILAFEGICSEKLSNNNLTDICFKGAPGSSNSTFYDNEGKGVGPFIMFYAEVLEYYNNALVSISVNAPAKTEYEVGDELDLTGLTVTATTRGGKTQTVTGYTVSEADMTTAGTKTVTVTYQGLTDSFEIVVAEPATEPTVPEETEPEATEPEVTEPEETEPVKEEVDVTVGEETVKVTVQNVTNVVTAPVAEADQAVVEEAKFENVLVFDMTADLAEGETAVISIPVPAGWDVNRVVGISVEDGVLKQIPGTVKDGVFSFEVDHFSAKGIALLAVEDWVTIPGEDKTIFRLTSSLSNGNRYLIVSSDDAGEANAVNLNGNSVNSISVTIIADDEGNYIDAPATTAQWTYTSNRFRNVSSTNRYLRGNNTNLSTTTSTESSYITWSFSNGLRVRQNANNGSYRYLRSDFETNTNSSSTDRVYIFVEDEISTDTTYARLSGELVQNYVVSDETTLAEVLALVKIETSPDRSDVDETVDVTEDHIEWDEEFDGSTPGTYTATVTYQGHELGSFTVTITDKTLDEGFVPVLTGNDPITIRAGETPDFSNIQLEVKFEGDETTTFITVENGLEIGEYDNTTVGSEYLSISYNGKEYGTVRLTVEGNPYLGKDEATEYPEYPADGAVRMDKTATEIDFENTGVVRVEMDVAGISVIQGVDVVLVADISNSMAWKAGAKNTAPNRNEGETTKWEDLQAAAGTFIDTLLINEDGSTTNNTVSFVTFGGYDAERNNNSENYDGYFDATRTVFTSESNAATAKSQINAFSITGIDADGYAVTINGENGGTAQGGTNYDYAFLEAAAAINRIKSEYAAANGGASYDESGREIYVVFMTDGAPDHYNQLYYKSRSNSQFDYYALYRNTSDFLSANYFDNEDPSLPNYANFVQRQSPNGYYLPTSDLTNDEWVDWIQSDSLYAAEQVMEIPRVHSITAVGFDLANGAFSNFSFSLEVLQDVLADLAGENSCDVYTTGDSLELNTFYESLAREIKFAGTQAQATDIIDSDFTLQLTQITGTGEKKGDLGFAPTITIKAYDLYPKGSVDEDGNDITGLRNGTESDIETVTFNEDGTAAYSNLVENGTKNIMETAADGTVTITAHYFTYTKTPEGVETFNWQIGDITDKEIALSFFAYLTGSLEGERSKGLYYTNEEATLEYVDINDKHASKTFPVPSVAWGGASTAYEFYLVNADGKPSDRNGNEIPFANRIIITGPFYEELYLNQEGQYVSKDIIAAYVLPAGYTLYDDSAKYSVVTASGSGKGSLTISEPAEGKEQTTIRVSATEPSFIQSRVAFGVLYNKIPTEAQFQLTPDQVVIDYGKEIVVNIANGHVDLEDGFTAELVGFNRYYDSVDLKTKFTTTTAIDNYEATYGTFKIEQAKGEEITVRYTPTDIVNGVENIFCVIKMTEEGNTNNFYYMVDKLTVIPATIVYYETDFADAFGTDDSWNQYTDNTYLDGTNPDGPQDSVTYESDDLYGFDSTYTNDSTLSNGSSLFGQGSTSTVGNQIVFDTTAEFTFTGTGFDLISRTGVDQGLIKVEVFISGSNEAKRTVSVLNKSESNLELYQIPVVSINDLPHDTYTVRISVDKAYENNTGIPALNVLNRGNQFYFDAVRIYDPVDVTAAAEGSDEAVALAAYVNDGEAHNNIVEVRANLIAAGTFDTESDEAGIVFVDRINDSTGETGAAIADYANIGPNNEVYLAGYQAIGFKVVLDPSNLPASIDLGLKSADGNPVEAYVEVWAGDQPIYASGEDSTIQIKSATVQFYDLIGKNHAMLNGLSEIYIFVSNWSNTILSVTDLKIGYGNVPGAVQILTDNDTVTRTIQNVQNRIDAENVKNEESINYNVISASFTTESVKRGKNATLVIETSAAVESIAVLNSTSNREKITIESVTTVDGVKVWTITLKSTATGTRTFTVVGYGADGNSGATATASIKVTR